MALSSYNEERTNLTIAPNVSECRALNGAIGFNRADVAAAVVECTGAAEGSSDHAAIMAALTRWGGTGHLFAPHLTAAEGMFQPALVATLLGDVCHQRREELAAALTRWAPPSPQLELGGAALDVFEPAPAMQQLLRELTGPAASTHEPTKMGLYPAHVSDIIKGTWRDESARAYLASELFNDGVLTFAAGCSTLPPRLRVASDAVHRQLFTRAAAALRKQEPDTVAAAKAFIVHRDSAPLAVALAAGSRPARDMYALWTWYDYEAAARLALALTAADSATGYTWRVEWPTTGTGSRAVVRGASADGRRHVAIEVQYLSVTTDIADLRNAPADAILGTMYALAATPPIKGVHAMTATNLLALRLAPRCRDAGTATVADVVAAAKSRVRKTAAAWLRATPPPPPGTVLDTYVAIAAGPCRWLIRRVY